MKLKQKHGVINILLADDDTDDCFFFDRALKEISIATHFKNVHDGEQLMYYLSKNTENLPDILFLDLSMPRKTGFECLSEIKANPNYNALYIIMFSTSYAQDVAYENYLIDMLHKRGAQEYIRKPDNYTQFKEIIYDVLTRIVEK